MQPELSLGPITLQTFGICFALAFICGGVLIWRRFDELGWPVDWVYEIGFVAVAGGFIGARLDYILENYSDVSDDLLGNVFSGSGLIWYGGAIGGTIGLVIWAWYRGCLGTEILDARRAGARARLRDRPHRLPALRRRRLRQALGRPMGDVLPRRHGADHRGGPPDAGLRGADDGRSSRWSSGGSATG